MSKSLDYVYGAIASRKPVEGGWIQVGVLALCQATGLSDKTVHRAILALVVEGALEHRREVGLSSWYRLLGRKTAVSTFSTPPKSGTVNPSQMTAPNPGQNSESIVYSDRTLSVEPRSFDGGDISPLKLPGSYSDKNKKESVPGEGIAREMSGVTLMSKIGSLAPARFAKQIAADLDPLVRRHGVDVVADHVRRIVEDNGGAWVHSGALASRLSRELSRKVWKWDHGEDWRAGFQARVDGNAPPRSSMPGLWGWRVADRLAVSGQPLELAS